MDIHNQFSTFYTGASALRYAVTEQMNEWKGSGPIPISRLAFRSYETQAVLARMNEVWKSI